MRNLHEFHEYVLRCFPAEAVGIVVGDEFVPCANVSADPLDSFQIELNHPAWAADEVDYVVHSHTSPAAGPQVDPRTPSKADMVTQVELDLPFAIVHCDGQAVSPPVFFGTTRHRPPLEDREFIFNAQDCLTLAADYLHATHGLELPSCPRDWDWFMRGERLFDDLWQDWGFIEVPAAEARPSDVIFYRMGTKFTNHIGVYLGGDRLLHHQLGQLSGVSEASRLSKYMHKVIRHRTL